MQTASSEGLNKPVPQEMISWHVRMRQDGLVIPFFHPNVFFSLPPSLNDRNSPPHVTSVDSIQRSPLVYSRSLLPIYEKAITIHAS